MAAKLSDPSPTCSNCGSSPEKVLLRCCRCKSTLYCNKICQTQHWKKSHKSACKPPPDPTTTTTTITIFAIQDLNKTIGRHMDTCIKAFDEHTAFLLLSLHQVGKVIHLHYRGPYEEAAMYALTKMSDWIQNAVMRFHSEKDPKLAKEVEEKGLNDALDDDFNPNVHLAVEDPDRIAKHVYGPSVFQDLDKTKAWLATSCPMLITCDINATDTTTYMLRTNLYRIKNLFFLF